MPVITQPFDRVAIDIVGPLPRTKSGYSYLLTMIDYGSRCPDAVPLKSTDSKSIATALLSMFSREGTKSGYSYLLTMIDYGSRYPDAEVH
jgi:hypothetical protein